MFGAVVCGMDQKSLEKEILLKCDPVEHGMVWWSKAR